MKARLNPFRTSRVHRIRYALDEAGWGALMRRFEADGRRGALVGPHGAGKTTLLEDLGERLEAAGVPVLTLRLDDLDPTFDAEKSGRVEQAPAPAVVLLDGGELLRPPDRRRLESALGDSRGIVATLHRQLRTPLRPWLPLLHRCDTSPERLHAIVSELLGEDDEVSMLECRRLWKRHHGNLRDALRELYDRWATREDPVEVVHNRTHP